jgi:hypothetical protein
LLTHDLFLQAVDNVGTTCSVFFEVVEAKGYEMFVEDDFLVSVYRTDDRF